MARIRPWIIDASNIRFTDVATFRERLLHETVAIERFLDNDASEETIVAGPKGVGKSLLVLAKRRTLADRGSVNLLPQNDLVDRPGFGNIGFRKEDAEAIRSNPHFWSQTWNFVLVSTILKQTIDESELAELCERMTHRLSRKIISDPGLTSIFDIVSALFEASRGDYFGALRDKIVLLPVYRRHHTPIALFFDNIDEFLDEHLRGGAAMGDSARSGFDPEFWYQAQMGAAMAIRDLAGINPHIRIYCSIRKEALERAISVVPQGQQVGGSCLSIGYGEADLLEIIEKNINVEDKKRYADPKARTAIGKFFGSSCQMLEHKRVRRMETVTGYVLRHTLGRPRDVMQVCGAIADIAPIRRTPESIKESVNREGRKIAVTYLAECRPHLKMFDEKVLWPLLPSNVIPTEALRGIAQEYNDRFNAQHEPLLVADDLRIFEALYQLGLLGYVGERVASAQLKQNFRLPGETFAMDGDELPISSTYLLHPILYPLIAASNQAFYDHIDSFNIVGPGMAWTQPPNGMFVLQGDVVEFSGLPEASRTSVRKLLAAAVDEVRRNDPGAFFGGDSVWVASRSPLRLLFCAQEMKRRIAEHMPPRDMRFGLAYGALHFEKVSGKDIESGESLRVAQRLQARAQPGTMLMSKEARTVFGDDCPESESLGSLAINKEKEPPEYCEVYQIALR